MGVTRRHLLVSGATLLGSALAGCSGDQSNGGTDDRTSFLRDYREVIVQELDIEIAQLRVQDGAVRLQYTSSFATDTEELGYEVGFISGRFGRFVADGWSVDRLAASADTADGKTLSWSVSAETARAFATDEITVDEFIDRVFATVTVE